MSTPEASSNFIQTIATEDLAAGRHQQIITRFPPEPNGYPHIGHAKSICLNFGLAHDLGGICHLRMDDTNPLKEDQEYVDALARDVHWLGFDWGEHFYHASDYFQDCYHYAIKLIRAGKAYVDSLNEEEIRIYRGTVSEPARPSPYRDRSIDENLALFEKMRAGEFPDGTHVLRARGDLCAANMKMRDPLLYRIRHASHHRSGDKWCIYPMYDYAHPISDAIEGITHSICTLEFENNRDIYNWVIENCEITDKNGNPAHPKQIEFARLNLTSTVVSKRKLLRLVQENHVRGWDDPRMPTLAGLRRRGVRPEALRQFCDRIGVAKANSVVELEALEGVIREDLNTIAPRVMGVLKPLKVTLVGWDQGVIWKDASLWPQDQTREERRSLPLSGEIYIDREDFEEVPPKGFHRLAPGKDVRLRHGPVVRCEEVIKDEAGNVTELRCSWTWDSAGRKVPGTIHWVSIEQAVKVEFRLYDRLFTSERPDAEDDFLQHIHPHSLEVVEALIEPFAARAAPGSRFQFERVGYFFLENEDSTPERPVFNRIVGLRDSWAKEQKKAEPTPKPEPTRTESKPEATRQVSKHDKVREPTVQARFDALLGGGVSVEDADLISLDTEAGALFSALTALNIGHRSAAAWVANDVQRVKKDHDISGLDPAKLAVLIGLVENGKITSRIGRDLLPEVVGGADPVAVVTERGLGVVSDRGPVEKVIRELMEKNADKVAAFRGGRTGLAGFFVGAAMKATQGKADPVLVQSLVTELLTGE